MYSGHLQNCFALTPTHTPVTHVCCALDEGHSMDCEKASIHRHGFSSHLKKGLKQKNLKNLITPSILCQSDRRRFGGVHYINHCHHVTKYARTSPDHRSPHTHAATSVMRTRIEQRHTRPSLWNKDRYTHSMKVVTWTHLWSLCLWCLDGYHPLNGGWFGEGETDKIEYAVNFFNVKCSLDTKSTY